MIIKTAGSTALLESLSDSRISILHLARQAKETKDMALAKELTEKGQSLKIEMARISTSGAPSAALSEGGRIRRTLTVEWTKEAAALLKRSKTTQSELTRLAATAEKSARKTKVLARALNAVSNVLALVKKVP
ncbi:MAG: hypothetical protein KBD85_03475 [Elusimicrobia bacterium]|nr:hypothetical protein [Elusimicrobiota bacterium]MBP9127259.1 hypothetical protein [Elusimicrobiota bacterium]MBP9699057.1 hypothetical protein [Elusimicrobiota bacterium]